MSMHGRRLVVRLLLEPHKAALLTRVAQGKNRRVSDMAREMVYESLRRECDADFTEADSADEIWIRSRTP